MNDILTAQQIRTLRAAFDRMIPADDYPSAWEAGCGDYIANQLRGQLSHLKTVYAAGLEALDAEASIDYNADFADISADGQDAILQRAECADVRCAWRTPPGRFIAMLAEHAAEGYYADPGQGGNRDRASWRMIGFQGK